MNRLRLLIWTIVTAALVYTVGHFESTVHHCRRCQSRMIPMVNHPMYECPKCRLKDYPE